MAFPSSRCCFAVAFVIAALVPCVSAQRGGGVDPSRAGGAVDMSNAGSPVMERNSNPRSVFVSGKVLFQGAGPAQQVLIERICNGMVRREGYTNTKGSFQFELVNSSTERDASQSDSDRMVANKMVRTTSAGGAEIRFDDCELRASLPGFISTTVPMRVDNEVSELQVGTIVLKKLGRSEGSVVSVTDRKSTRL